MGNNQKEGELEMKKRMLFGIVLSAVMVLLMGVPAFAQENGDQAASGDTVAAVEKLSYTSKDPILFYENTGGKKSEDGNYYIYPTPQPKFGDKLYVTRDGKVTEYTLVMDPDSDEDIFLSEDGDKICVENTSPEIQGERLKVTTDQETNHWTVGAENFAPVSYGGAECQVPVTIEASPVDEIVFTPYAEEHFYSITTDMADENGYYGMYFDFERGDIIEVTFKNGDTKVFRCGSHPADADQKVWIEDGNESNILPWKAVAFASDQDQTKWNIEKPNDNYIYVTYLGGKSQHIPVTLYHSISDAKVKIEKTALAYTGKTITPPAVKSVKCAGKKLRENVDYVVSTPDEEYFCIGKYSLIVEGVGNYKDSVEAAYSIVPKGTTMKSSKASKKSLTVKWNKQSDKMKTWRSGKKAKHIDGYEVQVSTSKSFAKKDTKTIKVKGYSKTYCQATNLKSGKRYYIKVRTYTDSGAYMMASDWSKVVTSPVVK